MIGCLIKKLARTCVMPIAVSGLFLAPLVASAAPVDWILNNVTFDGGGSATGSFIYDSVTGAYSNWDIAVSSTGDRPAYSYVADSGFAGSPTSTQVDFVAFSGAPASGRYLRLAFSSALTDAGGPIDLALSGASFECSNCANKTYIISGSVIAAAVPEPESYAMLLVGLGLVGAISRRRTKKTNA